MSSTPTRNRLEASLELRVAHAYHDYARFCSAHPNWCLSISVFIMMLLSYPAIARFQMPNSNPVVIHRTARADPFERSSAPEWFRRPPALYIQQVLVRSKVHPWSSFNLSAEHAVRGSLSLSFALRDLLKEHLQPSCLSLSLPSVPLVTSSLDPRSAALLPKDGCILLSPSAFWDHDKWNMARDQSVLDTLFAPPCTPSMCVRDILLGMPAGLAGVKHYYQTNRNRNIEFALTILLSSYDSSALSSIRSSFASPSSSISLLPEPLDEKLPFAHVFFLPRKHLTDYAPLLLSYLAFMIYVFFSASKFEMVSSRWGLALAAGGSVSFSLLMTAGLAFHLDLGPAIWGGEIFPYLALIIGLENLLCITKSVVYTPPIMDVACRLSLGLAAEGYSLTKYFVLEEAFLAAAYLIFPQVEIREFCTFASIGLIVDFYMQMFFYTPCLTFDLQALTEEEKGRFSRLLLSTDIPKLRHFPPVSCPIKRLLPRLFRPKVQIRRVHSEPRLQPLGHPERGQMMDAAPDWGGQKVLRRAASVQRSNSVGEDSDGMSRGSADSLEPPALSARSRSFLMAIFSFVTRTRIIQRTIMCVFVVWTVWLGYSTRNSYGRILETSKDEWQRRTFRWWPALLAEYNLSLAGHYTTFLPPIYLSTTIPPDHPSLVRLPRESNGSRGHVAETDGLPPTDLKWRVSWLEKQLLFYLAVSVIFIFAAVATFLVYICFWDHWQKMKERKRERHVDKGSLVDTTSARTFASLPLPIAVSTPLNGDSVAVVSSDGRLLLWSTKGRRPVEVDRTRPGDGEETETRSVWALVTRGSCLLLGCSDGCVEVASSESLRLLSTLHSSSASVVHMAMRSSILVVARIDGTLEFASLQLSSESPSTVVSFTSTRIIRSHRSPIGWLVAAPLSFLAVGIDPVIKAFDSRSSDHLFTVLAHKAPLSSIVIDHTTNMAFSACEAGLLCAWNLSGVLAWTSPCVSSVVLAVANVLVSVSPDGRLVLRDKRNGKKEAELTSQREMLQPASKLAAHPISASLVAVSIDNYVAFWDVDKKALVGEVEVELPVESLLLLSPSALVAVSQTSMAIVDVPNVQFR